jgi:hypothetical protein
MPSWPFRFIPQHLMLPPVKIAHVCCSPPVRVCNPTRIGVTPPTKIQHPQALSTIDVAYVTGKRSTQCETRVENRTTGKRSQLSETPRKSSTLATTVASTGLEYWVVPVLPVPSWPWWFDPQHLTPPPLMMTHEWEVPNVMAVATTPVGVG